MEDEQAQYPEMVHGDASSGLPWGLISVVILLLAVFGLCGFAALGVVMGVHTLDKGEELPQGVITSVSIADVEKRFAQDYPGWTIVGTEVQPYQFEGHNVTDFVVMATPPDREFRLGVIYKCTDLGPPVTDDELLRKDGLYHERYDQVLDYLERNYIEKDKKLLYVACDMDGFLAVEWEKDEGRGLKYKRVTDIDVISLEELPNPGGE